MTYRNLIALIMCLLLSAMVRAEVIDIDNTELARLMDKGVPLLDIRTPGEWKSTGVVKGSRQLMYSDERGYVDTKQWIAAVKAIASPDQPLILICRSGGRSKDAAKLLSETGGYKTVYSVKNGINRWIDERRTVVPATAAQ